MKYLASFRTTLKASRYMFRALALVLWLLIAFSSVFYIVNALHQRESEIRQEFNLSSDQAQRFIQRTSDVMKELKYIAENRLSAENGVLSPRGFLPSAVGMKKAKYLISNRSSRTPIVPR